MGSQRDWNSPPGKRCFLLFECRLLTCPGPGGSASPHAPQHMHACHWDAGTARRGSARWLACRSHCRPAGLLRPRRGSHHAASISPGATALVARHIGGPVGRWAGGGGGCSAVEREQGWRGPGHSPTVGSDERRPMEMDGTTPGRPPLVHNDMRTSAE